MRMRVKSWDQLRKAGRVERWSDVIYPPYPAQWPFVEEMKELCTKQYDFIPSGGHWECRDAPYIFEDWMLETETEVAKQIIKYYDDTRGDQTEH